MLIVLLVILIVAAAYTVFILAPAIVFYRVIFKRRGHIDMTKPDLRDPAFAPYEPAMADAIAFLRRQPNRPLSMTAADGVTLHGVWYDAGSDKTAVLLHGYNASPVTALCLQAAFLYRAGFNVAFLYQRGHGESGGVTTLGCKEERDLREFVAHLGATTGTRQVLLYGISMGCATAALASDRFDPDVVKGMVLDCGYTSALGQLSWEMRRRHLPKRLIAPLLTAWARRFLDVDITRPTTASLGGTRIPALFFHGERDETVPVSRGRENFEACASDKAWFSSDTAGHLLCYPSRQADCERLLYEFIKTHFS